MSLENAQRSYDRQYPREELSPFVASLREMEIERQQQRELDDEEGERRASYPLYTKQTLGIEGGSK